MVVKEPTEGGFIMKGRVKFLNIDNTQIKIIDIKSYGIDTYKVLVQKEQEDCSRIKNIFKIIDVISAIYHPDCDEKYVDKEYLYVNTYDGITYQFDKNVHEYLKKLDDALRWELLNR